MNPAVVTCSLTGYGETGPDAQRAGYDYTIQALAGVMSLAGEPDGPPTKAGISYVDHSGGISATTFPSGRSMSSRRRPASET